MADAKFFINGKQLTNVLENLQNRLDDLYIVKGIVSARLKQNDVCCFDDGSYVRISDINSDIRKIKKIIARIYTQLRKSFIVSKKGKMVDGIVQRKILKKVANSVIEIPKSHKLYDQIVPKELRAGKKGYITRSHVVKMLRGNKDNIMSMKESHDSVKGLTIHNDIFTKQAKSNLKSIYFGRSDSDISEEELNERIEKIKEDADEKQRAILYDLGYLVV